MIYCIDATVDEPIMLINTHIGFDAEEGQGVDGSLFQQELLQLDGLGKKCIQVWINSPGGVVMDGYNIYNAILKSKTKVDTYNAGIAASIAAVIFQAGRNRTMADYSLLMYHNPYGGNDGEQLTKMKNSICTMIAGRTGKSESEILMMMERTSWMSAGEAFEAGFCDTIEVSREQNRKRLAGGVHDMWREGSKILNSVLNKTTMNKVANKLGLVDGANEESIIAAIDSIRARTKDAEDKAAGYKAELDKLETRHKAELDDLKKKYEQSEADKAKAEKAKDDEQCKNMLAEFVRVGRIKSDAVAAWTETAKLVGIDKVKSMIEELPMSKKAQTIPVENTLEAGEMPTTAVTYMAKIQAKNKRK